MSIDGTMLTAHSVVYIQCIDSDYKLDVQK